MKYLIALWTLFSVTVFSPSDALAAPLGTSFTFQGRLDLGGIPVNGTATLRFTLWDALSGGNRIGNPDTQTNVPVANGLFVVLLNSAGQFGPDAFNGEARWLHVQVCSDPGCSSLTTLNPRQVITGAPYALGPWIRSASGNLSYMTGNVGIGTSTPTSKLEIAAQDGLAISGYQPFLTLRDTNGGNARTVIQSVNGGANTFTESYLSGGNSTAFTRLDNSGNLGIGTASPAKRLTVAGSAEIGTSHGDYQHLRIGGGNSSGFLYGSFPHFADGVHLGYNYYADGAGTNQVIHPDGGTSRITTGYGFVSIATQGAFAGEPINRLVVEENGNVRLGANTALYAPGGEENLRIIRGTVHGSSATIISGGGFQVTRNGAGKYTITFNTPFLDTPTVTVTPHLAVYVRVINTESITPDYVNIGVYLRDDGSYVDGTFNLIAIGAR